MFYLNSFIGLARGDNKLTPCDEYDQDHICFVTNEDQKVRNLGFMCKMENSIYYDNPPYKECCRIDYIGGKHGGVACPHVHCDQQCIALKDMNPVFVDNINKITYKIENTPEFYHTTKREMFTLPLKNQ